MACMPQSGNTWDQMPHGLRDLQQTNVNLPGASRYKKVKKSWGPNSFVMEPTTVGSLWLENDLHENELEFESHMGRSKKIVRVTSDGIHAEIHEI